MDLLDYFSAVFGEMLSYHAVGEFLLGGSHRSHGLVQVDLLRRRPLFERQAQSFGFAETHCTSFVHQPSLARQSISIHEITCIAPEYFRPGISVVSSTKASSKSADGLFFEAISALYKDARRMSA
jgi:hypothetical protein